MVSQSATFAKYSKPLCWVVSLISLLVAVVVFTGDSNNATLNGFLWLALAVVFAISAMILGRQRGTASSDGSADSDESGETPAP